MLKGVVNNAVIRRAKGVVSADDNDAQQEPWTNRSADEVVARKRLSGMNRGGGPEDKDAEGGEGGEKQR